MSKFDYSKSIASTKRLIDKFGKIVTHVKETQAAYNPARASAPTTTSQQISVVLLPESTRDEFITNNTKIQYTKLALFSGAGLTFQPEVGHRIGGFNVVAISALNPNESDVILYKAALTK